MIRSLNRLNKYSLEIVGQVWDREEMKLTIFSTTRAHCKKAFSSINATLKHKVKSIHKRIIQIWIFRLIPQHLLIRLDHKEGCCSLVAAVNNFSKDKGTKCLIICLAPRCSKMVMQTSYSLSESLVSPVLIHQHISSSINKNAQEQIP